MSVESKIIKQKDRQYAAEKKTDQALSPEQRHDAVGKTIDRQFSFLFG